MQEIACAVCGRRTALAPGAAMACPSCGAPLSAPALTPAVDDDSATRPSIPPVSATAAVETTRVAQPVGLAQDDDSGNTTDVTADFPMPPTPARTRTIPAQAMPSTESQTQPVEAADLPAAWPNTPAANVDSPPPARKRGPFARIASVLLIVLLLALVAAGVLLANGRLPFFNAVSTPTATVTLAPTATPASVLKTYIDPGNVYRIGHPNGWLETVNNDPSTQQRLIIWSNPTTGANFNVGAYASTNVSAQQVAATVLAALAQKTGIANHSQPSTAFYAGQSWAQESGDVTVLVNNKSTAMHAIALATIHGQSTIYILQLAPVTSFTATEPTFQQMMQSFEFLS
jgi:hypothetical protein